MGWIKKEKKKGKKPHKKKTHNKTLIRKGNAFPGWFILPLPNSSFAWESIQDDQKIEVISEEKYRTVS